ncbi:MAG: hypothetical protein ACHQIM_07325 [Sphingobacteriales bacterium]
MAWTIVLEDENKTTIISLEREFTSGIILDASVNCKFKLIKYLDPYGDTIFNHLQMDDLVSDFKKLQDIKYAESVETIIQLAEKCKIGCHTYLVFYGD